MCRVVFLFLLLMAAAPAWSGAWLREKDAAFTAASVTAFKDPDGSFNYKTALYAEYGLRPKVTIGLDLEQNRDYFGHALVFARVPVADFDDWGRFAAEFGAGAHYRLFGSWAMYKLTLSYGKGFQTGLGNGWFAVDAAWENRTHDAVFRKLDITTGLSGDRLLNPMMQIETSYTPESSLFWTVRPSVLIRGRDNGRTWVLGFERNKARNDTGVKFALWNTF
ncbi:hypothetical protein AVO44_14705 [Ruegeria profundi]|uniref:YaiO family outer membrane beta-barrel protein n=2 Tax=Ruegeria profundi TaxID=1685378 RepID=A0A0X3TRQ5_9RHOB|nr:hypothetical protein AVO44_14705 [Ruegeria profundi]